jgi:putative ABC transport system permease protein
MPRIPNLTRLLRLPTRSRERIARDVDDELGFHLEMRARELADAGMPFEAARAKARTDFGDLEYTRYYLRAMDRGQAQARRRTELVDELFHDLVYAVRQLRRAPLFAAVAIVTLALGIGANTAIFSVVDGVVLRPLPYREPDRLVHLFWTVRGEGGRVPAALVDVADWRRQTRSYQEIAAIIQQASTLTGDGVDAEQVASARVSAGTLSLVGARFIAGHTFGPRPDAGRSAREVVLGEGLWRRRYGADPAIVGRTISIDRQSYTVLGVVARETGYPARVELFLPLDLPPEFLTPHLRNAKFVRAIARLAPGVTVAQARAELQGIAARFAADYPQSNRNLDGLVVPLEEYTTGNVRRPLLVLLGAVGFVLLIACANVANLMLVRAAGRDGEIAVRLALGASRGRLVRQLLTESLLLALIGGAIAVGLAVWGTRQLVALAGEQIPRLAEVRADGTLLWVALALSLGTGLLFGLIPAVAASRPDLTRALKASGKGGALRVAGRRIRGALVVAELALSIMLLAGAGLLIRSFVQMTRLDPGFRTADVATFSIDLPYAGAQNHARWQVFTRTLLERLDALPGVRSADVVSGIPLGGASLKLNFAVNGRPQTPAGERPLAEVRTASQGYFATMGIMPLRGRLFTPDDRDGAAPVVVVNEALVRRYFPGENPIGKRLRVDFSSPLGGEIVGVIGNVHQLSLTEPTEPELYVVQDQSPAGSVDVVMAVAPGSTGAALAAARRAVRELDPSVPVVRPRAVADVVATSVSRPRFYTMLLGAFAGLALVLAAVGVYGVISYAGAQRVREIGIRMALGASRAEIVRMMLRDGLRLAAVGAVLGIAGAFWATSLLRDLLYGVGARDPLTFVGVAAMLGGAALAASWAPARRAGRVDPMVALRAE